MRRVADKAARCANPQSSGAAQIAGCCCLVIASHDQPAGANALVLHDHRGTDCLLLVGCPLLELLARHPWSCQACATSSGGADQVIVTTCHILTNLTTGFAGLAAESCILSPWIPLAW